MEILTWCRRAGALVVLAAFQQAALAQISANLFRHHYIATDMPGDNTWGFGTSALADFDKDGDLDYAVGNRGDKIYWFEYQAPDRWVRHELGPFSPSHLGAAVLDVDQDGWTDLIIGGYWYRNPQNPREQAFTRRLYDREIERGIHDIVIADVNGDGGSDVIVLGDGDGCFWYDVPDRPARNTGWPRTTISLEVRVDRVGIHSGFSPNGAGDLDRDGDTDLVLPDRWHENLTKGSQWKTHRLPIGSRGPWSFSARSWIMDLDRDGDADIVMTHSDQQNSAAAWLENNGKAPPGFTVHYLPNKAPGTRGSFHSLAVADFDADGDPDILAVEQEDSSILPVGAGPRWYIWENQETDSLRFEERVILDAALGGHDVRVGDVDGDGDLDIVSKVWNLWSANANRGRFHADFLENLVNRPAPRREGGTRR
jgi:hypothetical protein